MIEVRPNSKCKNYSFGMIPRMCRRHGLRRNNNTPIFVRHTVGVGGVYVYCGKDTVRVRVDELGFDFTTKDVSEVRMILEECDRADKILKQRWKKALS